MYKREIYTKTGNVHLTHICLFHSNREIIQKFRIVKLHVHGAIINKIKCLKMSSVLTGTSIFCAQEYFILHMCNLKLGSDSLK